MIPMASCSFLAFLLVAACLFCLVRQGNGAPVNGGVSGHSSRREKFSRLSARSDSQSSDSSSLNAVSKLITFSSEEQSSNEPESEAVVSGAIDSTPEAARVGVAALQDVGPTARVGVTGTGDFSSSHVDKLPARAAVGPEQQEIGEVNAHEETDPMLRIRMSPPVTLRMEERGMILSGPKPAGVSPSHPGGQRAGLVVIERSGGNLDLFPAENVDRPKFKPAGPAATAAAVKPETKRPCVVIAENAANVVFRGKEDKEAC